MAYHYVENVSSTYKTTFHRTSFVGNTGNLLDNAAQEFKSDVAFTGGSVFFSESLVKATPNINSRSLGTRMVLNPSITPSTCDSALGVSGNGLWLSSPGAVEFFHNTTKTARVASNGFFIELSNSLAANSTLLDSTFFNAGDMQLAKYLHFTETAEAVPTGALPRSTGVRMTFERLSTGYERSIGVGPSGEMWLSATTSLGFYADTGKKVTVNDRGLLVDATSTVVGNALGASSNVALMVNGDVGIFQKSLFFNAPLTGSLNASNVRTIGQCLNFHTGYHQGLLASGMYFQIPSGKAFEFYNEQTLQVSINNGLLSVINSGNTGTVGINPQNNDVISQRVFTTSSNMTSTTSITGLLFDATCRYAKIHLIVEVTKTGSPTKLCATYNMQYLDNDVDKLISQGDETFDTPNELMTTFSVDVNGQVYIQLGAIADFQSATLKWIVQSINK